MAALFLLLMHGDGTAMQKRILYSDTGSVEQYRNKVEDRICDHRK